VTSVARVHDWGVLGEMAAEDLLTAAEACADGAASDRGLRVVELSSPPDLNEAGELLRRVWRAAASEQLINTSVMRALSHSGNYVAGAYHDGRLVGVAVGFLGMGHLHSHITGVDTGGQSSGVGFALKQHQRAWALRHGLDAINWTFDPLVSRNAYFNLQKLGASATRYLPDFYGALDDGINAGDATDRLYVRWELTMPRAVAAARGVAEVVDLATLRAAGAVTLLDRAGDEPVPVAPNGGMSGPGPVRNLLVFVPRDIDALRMRDRALAMRWRYAVREALQGPLESGYRITGIAREGCYVLEGRR
jgi:predicted GNAT superfamily acetyltransferase